VLDKVKSNSTIFERDNDSLVYFRQLAVNLVSRGTGVIRKEKWHRLTRRWVKDNMQAMNFVTLDYLPAIYLFCFMYGLFNSSFSVT
jgi:hypothetical protein